MKVKLDLQQLSGELESFVSQHVISRQLYKDIMDYYLSLSPTELLQSCS